MRMRLPVAIVATLALAGCAGFAPFARKEGPAPQASDMATEFAPAVSVAPPGASGQRPEALDTTSAAEKKAALTAAPAAAERELGRQVVALGAPADPGLWVQTSLVGKAGKGRVVAPGGRSLAVELRPGSGAALMSLSAYQALGLSLTELPELVIFGS